MDRRPQPRRPVPQRISTQTSYRLVWRRSTPVGEGRGTNHPSGHSDHRGNVHAGVSSRRADTLPQAWSSIVLRRPQSQYSSRAVRRSGSHPRTRRDRTPYSGGSPKVYRALVRSAQATMACCCSVVNRASPCVHVYSSIGISPDLTVSTTSSNFRIFFRGP